MDEKLSIDYRKDVAMIAKEYANLFGAPRANVDNGVAQQAFRMAVRESVLIKNTTMTFYIFRSAFLSKFCEPPKNKK